MTVSTSPEIRHIDEIQKLDREIWNLKRLFVDMTFCYLNPDQTKAMYEETLKEFKDIVGDDKEFIDYSEDGA